MTVFVFFFCIQNHWNFDDSIWPAMNLFRFEIFSVCSTIKRPSRCKVHYFYVVLQSKRNTRIYYIILLFEMSMAIDHGRRNAQIVDHMTSKANTFYSFISGNGVFFIKNMKLPSCRVVVLAIDDLAWKNINRNGGLRVENAVCGYRHWFNYNWCSNCEEFGHVRCR